MKKEFIDFMYELRASIQTDIDRLVEDRKNPIAQCCKNMDATSKVLAELRTRRSQIESVNDTIKKYFELHRI